MGIYPNRGLEYVFQFRMALPLNLLAMVTEKGVYQPEYFPEVKRLVAIRMKETDARLAASEFYKDPKSKISEFSPSAHCRRVDTPIDITLTPEESSFIDKIANTPGLQNYIEHHGWCDVCYVWYSLDNMVDHPHMPEIPSK